MRYPEPLIYPMREELTKHGVEEARTPEDVDRILVGPGSGSVLMVVNSVCGCAAGCAGGAARRGPLAQGRRTPRHCGDRLRGRVADVEATAHLRQKLSMFPPSSPSVALFRDGEPVYMMHRHQIEGREASAIARSLQEAYASHCAAEVENAG